MKTEIQLLELAYDLELKRQEIARVKNYRRLRGLYRPNLPEVPNKNIPEKWDEYAERKEAFRLNPLIAERVSKTKKIIDLKGSILDIGVGYGYITKELLKEKGDFSYLGIDIAPKFVNKLQSSVKDKRFKFNTTDLGKIRTEFNSILTLELLEHIRPSHIFDFLNKLNNLLVPDGYLIISCPVFENIRELAEIRDGSVFTPSSHLRSYTPELLLAELELAGFKVESHNFVYGPFFKEGFKRRLKKIITGRNYAYNIIIKARK